MVLKNVHFIFSLANLMVLGKKSFVPKIIWHVVAYKGRRPEYCPPIYLPHLKICLQHAKLLQKKLRDLFKNLYKEGIVAERTKKRIKKY